MGLSTKNEQELGLDLESLVKINDPFPLPISDWQSKMLPPSSSYIKHRSVFSSLDCLIYCVKAGSLLCRDASPPTFFRISALLGLLQALGLFAAIL